jgi:hypothetical protein
VPDPVTPTKLLRNNGARHDNPDAETSSAESDEDHSEEKEPVAPKKRTRVLARYVPVKRWITGERAEMDDEDIENQLFEEARQLMQLWQTRSEPLLLDGIFSSVVVSLEIFAAGTSISSSCQLHPYHARTMSFACLLFLRRRNAIKFIL